MTDGIVSIRKGREKPIRNQHPWVFSGAIYEATDAEPGGLVTVQDHRGNFLGRGYWNQRSQIQVRILTWHDEEIDQDWWRTSIQRAIRQRYPQPKQHVANRIINAENDFLPGLIVDRYADFLVLQALTLHIDQRKEQIAQWLMDAFADAGMPIQGVYERSDVDVRGKEGLKPAAGVLLGEEPPELIAFNQGARIKLVDVRQGHKTGDYLDQVQNQDVLAGWMQTYGLNTPDSRQLNTFSYTGGFGLGTGAHVVNVDASYDALALAETTFQENSAEPDTIEYVQADVFDYLRDCADEGQTFDVVVLDPPKFAHNKQQVDRASRGYKDINLNAFKLIRQGGYLMTFSCSGAISRDLFQKIVFGALADSGRQAQIVKYLSASDDHPVALTFPEGEYLKGLLLRVY